MSMLSDLLNRQSGVAPAKPVIETAPPAAPKAKAARPLPANPLPPLNLPRQWAMELQKIVFQLSHTAKGETRQMSFMFSSLAKGSGTTTVSYCFAYLLAADDAHRNVLFVDVDPAVDKAPAAGAMATLFVGMDNSSAQWSAPDTNLGVVSVRLGPDRSTASSTAWFYDFMSTAHQTYDAIVVDAPPIAFTPMAYAPARACDGVVLVLRCGESRYPAINNLVDDLSEMGIASLGAILNYRQYPVPRALLKLL